jgi:hypothetical protein
VSYIRVILKEITIGIILMLMWISDRSRSRWACNIHQENPNVSYIEIILKEITIGIILMLMWISDRSRSRWACNIHRSQDLS